MSRTIAERDWKIFRELRPLALELIQERDREIADSFNDFRRSTALMIIMGIYNRGLWTEEESARFGPEIHELHAQFYAEGRRRPPYGGTPGAAD